MIRTARRLAAQLAVTRALRANRKARARHLANFDRMGHYEAWTHPDAAAYIATDRRVHDAFARRASLAR